MSSWAEAVEVVSLLYRPTKQDVQVEEEDAAVVSLHLPEGHVIQDEAAEAELLYLAGGQLVQSEAESWEDCVYPLSEIILPPAQEAHVLLPVDSAYLPEEQIEHVEEDVAAEVVE